MLKPKAFHIDQLFEGSLRRLSAEAEYFSHLTDHNPEMGRLNESHLVRLLRDYLPPKIGIGTGFIASGGKNPQQSPQCDIVLYDALNNAPLYKSDAWSIYPIEMVYGVIEVKTNLTKAQLKDAFQKCAKIRAMAKTPEGDGNKAYIRLIPSSPPKPVVQQLSYRAELPPRFFVFGYNGWKTASLLEKNFKAVSEEGIAAHIHGVCNLFDGGSLYIHHRAYGKEEERFSQVTQNGFRHFLMNLPKALNSMLPPERYGMGFDHVDMNHYALGIE